MELKIGVESAQETDSKGEIISFNSCRVDADMLGVGNHSYKLNGVFTMNNTQYDNDDGDGKNSDMRIREMTIERSDGAMLFLQDGFAQISSHNIPQPYAINHPAHPESD